MINKKMDQKKCMYTAQGEYVCSIGKKMMKVPGNVQHDKPKLQEKFNDYSSVCCNNCPPLGNMVRSEAARNCIDTCMICD